MEHHIILRTYEEDCQEKIELFERYAILSGATISYCSEDSNSYEEECTLFKSKISEAFSTVESGGTVFFIGRDIILKDADELFKSVFNNKDRKSILITPGTESASIFELSAITKNKKTIQFVKDMDPSAYSEIKHRFPNLQTFTLPPHNEALRKINLQLLDKFKDVGLLECKLEKWNKEPINKLFSEKHIMQIVDLSNVDIVTRNLIARESLKSQEKHSIFKFQGNDDSFAIVTVMDDGAAAAFEEFKKSYLKYCKKHNLSLYIFKNAHLQNVRANWSKAFYLKNILNKHDAIMWVDTDTVVMNYEKNAFKYLDDSKLDVIFFEDAANTREHKGTLKRGWELNSGVFLLKNSECGRELIKTWEEIISDVYRTNGNKIESVYHAGGDQSKLIDSYKELKNKFENKMKIMPCETYNVHPKFSNSETCVVHFMGYGDYNIRALIMAEYNKIYMS